MNRLKAFAHIASVFSALLLVAVLAGCAAKTAATYGSPETGLMMTYQEPASPLKYKITGDQTQNIEVMGQTVSTVTKSSNDITVTGKGKKDGNLLLGVTINDMKVSMSGMQGDLTPDMSTVIGKSFEMVVSPLGKELEINGADEIKFDIGMGAGERGVKSGYRTLFTDLYDKPLKVGDKWDSQEIMNVDEGGMKMQMVFNYNNTLTAIENVDGVECAKVDVVTKGTITGTGTQMGMDLAIEGDIEGTGIWYFAYKGGYLMKNVSEGFIEGTIAASGAQNLTIPMTQEMKSEMVLVK